MKLIDPDGKSVYCYDDDSGDFHLEVPNDDKFDQVGKFDQNKETGEYTLQTDRKGNAKTRIDNIEKGILSDGANFKNKDNIIEVGGKEQASVEGVEGFALKLSEMVGKEIAGAYFSKDGSSETTHVTIGSYKDNRLTKSGGYGNLIIRSFTNTVEEFSSYKLTGFFHTHPTMGYSESARTNASPADIESKHNQLENNSNLKFFILTQPIRYDGKFPYKREY